jgi:hypothetical protein
MPRRDPAKERYWRRLLRQWRRSGMTPRQFCVDQNISEASFYVWRREIARRDAHKAAAQKQPSVAAVPAFVKLAMDPGTALPPAIEVVVAERRLLRVRPGFDADLFRQLVRLLEEPSC